MRERRGGKKGSRKTENQSGSSININERGKSVDSDGPEFVSSVPLLAG